MGIGLRESPVHGAVEIESIGREKKLVSLGLLTTIHYVALLVMGPSIIA